jgi:hypothetical protein
MALMKKPLSLFRYIWNLTFNVKGRLVMKKQLFFVIVITIILSTLISGCGLEPDQKDGTSADGIYIFSGNELLNNTTWEIVTGRVQQLRAISLSGHNLIWSSSNILAMEVTQTGLVRVGPSPNKESVITVISSIDPSKSAKVTFRTKGLR